MSKKNKQVHTQKQMLNSVMNNPVLFEDADICKKLLVAYLHDQTDGMDDKTKYKFAQEIVFPLRKRIDLFFELDKLNNKELLSIYYRMKPNFVDSASDYFCLIALVAILIIMHDYNIIITDDELFELAIFFAFKPDISVNEVNKKLFEIREGIKKQKTN